MTRRRLLRAGVVGVAAIVGAGVAGVELVDHGVLPGKQALDQLDGACSVTSPTLDYCPLGPSHSGSFFSKARGRQVGYTIAYPPGTQAFDALPLIVMLHGYGANHTNALSSMSPAQAVALRVDGQRLRPMAMVTVDGGGGYWNPHPGDNPMGMVIDEVIPLCQKFGLGAPPHGIGTMGISMGGYGAILLAEKYPSLISAVAAISPAVWTTYDQARAANAGAFTSATSFEQNDVVTHVAALRHTRVRVASGNAEPFHPGVETLTRVLPTGAEVDFSNGCHTGPFFVAQEPLSLDFLSRALT
jgi:pimeloyl-ACP methyl ester carboxylesterase